MRPVAGLGVDEIVDVGLQAAEDVVGLALGQTPTATIKTEAEVDAYLAQLREILMGHVDADETVIL